MIWHVARTAGTIVAAFSYPQPGYADETLDDATDAELQTFLAPKPLSSILRSQGLQQLSADGKLDAYTTALSSADKLTQLLAQSPTWLRADPRLNAMAKALGYDTAAKIDAFFVAASKIT